MEEVGKVKRVERVSDNVRFGIEAAKVIEDLKRGDSISVNGVCLTVIEVEDKVFWVEATSHTLQNTTLNFLTSGGRVNLERALRWGDRLGGHLVQGHVEGKGRVSRVRYQSGSMEVTISIPPQLGKAILPKGSVAIEGVSLTVVEKTSRGFKVVIVPYTIENSTLGDLKPGQEVNIETDIISRYLAEKIAELWSRENLLNLISPFTQEKERGEYSSGFSLED